MLPNGRDISSIRSAIIAILRKKRQRLIVSLTISSIFFRVEMKDVLLLFCPEELFVCPKELKIW
jgi:hypothetical protein